MIRRAGTTVVLAIGLGLSAPTTAFADLSVVPGPAGCTAQAVMAGCQQAPGLLSPQALAVDGGGRVFVAARESNALTLLRRGDDGRLLFAGCLSDDGTDGRFGFDGVCADGDGLREPVAVAAAPVGGRAYVLGRLSRSLAVARTDTTWAAERLSCFADRGFANCTDVIALGAPEALAVSPAGEHVYVVGRDTDGVVPFAIDPASGAGAQRGCITDNGTDGVCSDGESLRGARAVVVSPDGRHVYVGASVSQAIAIFTRAGDGSLTQIGCVEHEAPAGSCGSVLGLRGLDDLAMSADGRRLYAAAAASGAVSVFDRDPATGTLRQVTCAAVVAQPGCGIVPGLRGATAIEVSPTGSILVAAAQDNAVVELADDRASGALRLRSCLAALRIEGCAQTSLLAFPVDVLAAADGRIHVASAGNDAVLTLSPGPAVAASVVRTSARRAVVPVRCPLARRAACRGRVLLDAGRRRLGSAPFQLRAGSTREIRVRLRTRRAVARTRALATLRENRTRTAAVSVVLTGRRHR